MEENKEVVETEQKEVVAENAAKEPKEGKKMKEKKPGKVRAFLKRHKREFIAGGLGILAGAGSTFGVGELGRRHSAKKAAAPVQQNSNISPLDPNVE